MILMLRSGQGYYFAAAGPQLADATLLQNVAKYRSWPKNCRGTGIKVTGSSFFKTFSALIASWVESKRITE